jgi:hypothetical protein
MPRLAPVLLLIVAACPISASVVIVAILPARAEIFSGAASGAFLTQLYFVAPALFAALGSLALRRVAARGAPERFLVVGALGFAAFGLADGLNTDHAGVAFAMRAGVGVSIACLMTGFNRIAMQRWDRATSTWLLTYLNLATSAYGLAAALLAAQLALWSEYAPFLLFGLPALGLAAYLATAPGARAVPAPRSGGAPDGGPKAGATPLPPGHMALIVVGHMAVHVLFYLHLARTEVSLGGHALGGGERTALYVFGHVLGAMLFRPASRLFGNSPAHLAAALCACLLCTGGLAAIDGGGAAAWLLLPLGGLALSHVLPLVFASIRDSVPPQDQGRRIADAVAAGFLGQFAAPFILQALQAFFGTAVSPGFAALIISALLMPSAAALLAADRRRPNPI